MRGYAAIGLYNPIHTENIGGALRAAYCYKASLVLVAGGKCKNEPEDTYRTARHIPVIKVKNFENPPEDCAVVAVELVEEAESLIYFKHPQRALYVFGPENGSLPEEILQKATHKVQVPTHHCMNLAACVNVVLYDRLLKQKTRLL